MSECATAPLVMPLERAAICLDCEAVFELAGTCPACASAQVMSLARWLNRGSAFGVAAAVAVPSEPGGAARTPAVARRISR